ncbi:hypothetical protein [Vibrio proteolyticus]|uniref:Uncharacterized protein n=1 Tax=Vibrio proteolyticus NBRC 13287 TaxID=1219065 RepID=U3BBE2_VIBPR|nr:hypothetical protein [Vibrio proteolyticus]GAD67114.1 hypothetical protein VPR01S_06_01320 [Vibrio proteolyticus NBRC 13287]
MLKQQLYERYLPGYSESKSNEEKQRLWQQAAPETIYQLNSELQKLHGEGADFLSLSDPMRAQLGVSIWPDLLAMDIAFWREHQHWLMHNDIPPTSFKRVNDSSLNCKIPQNYINQYNGEHLRLYYQSQLVYGRLYSALHYILNHVKSAIDTWIEERYPYQLPSELYFPSDDEQPTRSQITYRRSDNFNYQSLKRYFNQHYSSWLGEQYLNWMLELNQQLNRQTAATYIVEYCDAHGSPCVDFICKNESTLRMIRPDHFVEDMLQMASSTHYLEHEVQLVALDIEKRCRAEGW